MVLFLCGGNIASVVIFKKLHMRERCYGTELRWRSFYWGKMNGESGEGRGETDLYRQE